MTALSWMPRFVQTVWPHSQDPRADDQAVVDRIRDESDQRRRDTDKQLVDRSAELRYGERSEDDQLVASFALANAAAQRAIGIEYYDVQLLAGMTLARGRIAEMQTGEGKTFVAALPAVSFALAGRGVHVMTVNDYLAERDAELLAPLYGLLGLSVACLKPQSATEEKRSAYACDITYGPGYEFGFDYLRDQASVLQRSRMQKGETFRSLLSGRKPEEAQPVQRGHAYAIIDEIDSVLIDEASSPLILSEGPPEKPVDVRAYLHARRLAMQLKIDDDFVVEAEKNLVRLTQVGAQKANAAAAECHDLNIRRPWTCYIEQALRAKELLVRDVDYIVDDDAIVLVDQSTGRIFRDRSLRDGLHQAIEAKEDVAITSERNPLARIPRQRYVRLYDNVCGMTGTASGSEREFWEFYRLEITRIPLRQASRRVICPPRFFLTKELKLHAIADDVQQVHATSQPVLVGTPTIEASQQLASELERRGVRHQLLNGVQDADEATIVAQAGTAGAVTIATNMAGRGTDIKLGDGVAALGGLHVIASEPNESARVDRQLVGRCARQGDPGSYRLYVSAEDRLLTSHGPELAARIERSRGGLGQVAEDLYRTLAKVQRKAERRDFSRRRQSFAGDAWLESVLSTLAKQSS